MNRLFALVAAIVLLAGCKKPEFMKTEAEMATPVPVPTPVPAATAAATPKPGWMWKDYKNPLDAQKPKR